MTNLWHRITRPFRTQTLIFDRTRIRVRSFPPLFEHERVASIAEQFAASETGDVVQLEDAVYVVYDGFDIPFGVTLKGSA